MSLTARTIAKLDEIETLDPSEFENADVNLLLANYNEISEKLARKLVKFFKTMETSGLQQRKFIEVDDQAMKIIGAGLAPATQKWIFENAADFSAEFDAMLVSVSRLTNVSPALKNYVLENFDALEAAAQKSTLKFFGVRKADDLPVARRRPVKEEPAPVKTSGRRKAASSDETPVKAPKTSKSSTKNLRDAASSMDASEDNLAIISIFGAPNAREAHAAAKEIDLTQLENSSIKRFVKAMAATRVKAEIETLKERFAKRHADLLENTGSADSSSESSSEEKAAPRPRTSKKNAFADKIEGVVGKKQHHEHPRESDRLTNSGRKVRRPASSDEKSSSSDEIMRNVRKIRRPS